LLFARFGMLPLSTCSLRNSALSRFPYDPEGDRLTHTPTGGKK
jgi:hypothetical protein